VFSLQTMIYFFHPVCLTKVKNDSTTTTRSSKFTACVETLEQC